MGSIKALLNKIISFKYVRYRIIYYFITFLGYPVIMVAVKVFYPDALLRGWNAVFVFVLVVNFIVAMFLFARDHENNFLSYDR